MIQEDLEFDMACGQPETRSAKESPESEDDVSRTEPAVPPRPDQPCHIYFRKADRKQYSANFFL